MSTTATLPQNPSTSSSALRAVQVQPYLCFEGRCEEAIAFYQRALGAQVTMLMRFKDAPPSPSSEMCAPPPGIENKVMHASFRIGSTEVCATDGYANGQPKFDGISLSLTLPDVANSERAFNALADGGKVEMPLGPTFFSPSFGMLNDRFGVRWMFYVAPQNQPGAKSPA